MIATYIGFLVGSSGLDIFLNGPSFISVPELFVGIILTVSHFRAVHS